MWKSCIETSESWVEKNDLSVPPEVRLFFDLLQKLLKIISDESKLQNAENIAKVEEDQYCKLFHRFFDPVSVV